MAQVFGSENGNAKLTEAHAREIYILSHGGEYTLREIAQAYGVAHSVVYAIKVGRIWGQATKEIGEEEQCST
jgi:hypothetical protein